MAIINRFNVGGTWKSPTEIYINAGDNWKSVTEIKIAVERTDNLFDQVSSGYHDTSYGSQYGTGYAVDEDKVGWSWGWNYYGQLGINSTSDAYRNTSIYGQHKFSYIFSAGYTVFGLDTNSKLWGWGYNSTYGAIGDDSSLQRNTPVTVCGNHSFSLIAPYLGIDNHNKTWSWGFNYYGVVGDNTVICRKTPVAVCGGHTFCVISSREWGHSLGIDNKGKAWGWGLNGYGQLGDNTTTYRSTPIAVCGGHTFCKITSGSAFNSFALDSKGKAWGWGEGNFGKLGNNSTLAKNTPVAVCGNHTFCQIATGLNTCGGVIAIDNNNKGWWWGICHGNAPWTKTCNSTPVAIPGNHTFCFVSYLGDRTYLLIDNHKQTWGWGYRISDSPITITQYGLKWK